MWFAYEATFLFQETRSELSQNEASSFQCLVWNQRKNRYVHIHSAVQKEKTLNTALLLSPYCIQGILHVSLTTFNEYDIAHSIFH